MGATKSELLSDKIVVTVRWLGLVIMAVILGRADGLVGKAILLLGVTAIWNLISTGLTLANRRLPRHEILSIVVDALLGLGFFYFGTLGTGRFVWGGLLPVLTGTFYHGLRGGVILSVGIALIEGLALAIELPGGQAMGTIGLPAGVFLGVGVVLGGLAQQMDDFIRRRQFEEESLEDDEDWNEGGGIKPLYNITSSMTTTLNYQRVREMALDLTASALSERGKENRLVSAFCLFEGDELHIVSARQLAPGDENTRMKGDKGLIVKALGSGRPKVTRSPAKDSELQRISALRECREVYCFPLRTQVERYGALLFGHPEESYFDGKRQEILDIVGNQALLALQNAELYTNLEVEKKRLAEIQEEARKKLARNLHDGPTQSVAAIAMRVNFARRLMDRDAQKAGEELFKIEELARRTTKEIRHMLFTLRPLVLESSGLVAALESLAKKMGETYNQKVIIEADQGALIDLEMEKQGVIFYIAEEAVNNARKHAGAEHIWARLMRMKGEVVLLEVQDDGVGFNVGEVDTGYDRRGSLGLVNMRERTEIVNGVLKLDSEVGKGTCIRVWVPLNGKAADKLRHARLD